MHLIVHDLDNLRHFLAFMWSIWNWIGNVSAGLIVGACTMFLWPRIRRQFERFVDRKLKHHLDEHRNKVETMVQTKLDDHLKAVKTHIDSKGTA